MTNTSAEAVPMSFTRFNGRGSIPTWAKTLNAERATTKEVVDSKHLPGVTVLIASDPSELKHHHVLVGKLSERLRTSKRPCKLVLSINRLDQSAPDRMNAALTPFRKVVSNVEVSVGKDALQSSVYEALVKYLYQLEEFEDDPLASALDIQKSRHPFLNKATGRLDAKKVAKALGMSTASLATLIGKHRATISKTPDAPALQGLLRPFERLLRLRAIMPQDQFLAWLESPNDHLEQQTPRSLINKGRIESIADLAEDALTGQPT